MSSTNGFPHLINHMLDEEVAATFTFPVAWEIHKAGKADLEMIYAGLLDYDNKEDRKHLAQLAGWAFDNGYMLLTYREDSAA